MDKEFVDLIVYSGLTKEEAYQRVFEDNKVGEELSLFAERRLNRVDNLAYYNALMADLNRVAEKKLEWNRELATEHLMTALAYGEKVLYQDKKTANVPLVQMIQNSIKELNLMHGLNEAGKVATEDKTIFIPLAVEEIKQIDGGSNDNNRKDATTKQGDSTIAKVGSDKERT